MAFGFKEKRNHWKEFEEMSNMLWLPFVPVGEGARWEVGTQLGGFAITQAEANSHCIN